MINRRSRTMIDRRSAASDPRTAPTLAQPDGPRKQEESVKQDASLEQCESLEQCNSTTHHDADLLGAR